jgi:hypothetical protein
LEIASLWLGKTLYLLGTHPNANQPRTQDVMPFNQAFVMKYFLQKIALEIVPIAPLLWCNNRNPVENRSLVLQKDRLFATNQLSKLTLTMGNQAAVWQNQTVNLWFDGF